MTKLESKTGWQTISKDTFINILLGMGANRGLPLI